MQNWTIQKLLNWTTDYFTKKGIDSPRLSAELLLSHALTLPRIELYTQFDRPVAKQQLDTLHDLVKRAGGHEPIAYLTGKTEFYSLELNITPACLIPRPETELLVDNALEFLKSRTGPQLVCDLCTGTACVAIAIAKNLDKANLIAADISKAALDVAAENIQNHNLKSRIKLLCGDLFDPVAAQLPEQKFDLITCNPPYVTASEFEALDKNVKDYEPPSALLAGKDGLQISEKIIRQADTFLKDDAALMLEIGHNQSDNITALINETKCFTQIRIEKDFQNIPRVAIAQKKTTKKT